MVNILSWEKGKIKEYQGTGSFKKEPLQGLFWLDCFKPTGEELGHISSVLKLHPVTLEVLTRPTNRPRITDNGRYFVTTIHVPEGRLCEPHSHEIDIVVGENWILTVHDIRIKSLLKLQELARSRPEIMSQGSDFFLEEMLELLLERFFTLIEWLDDRIGRLEDEIPAGRAEDKSLQRIGEFRRAVNGLRRIMINQREVIANLSRGETKFIQLKNLPYFRDLFEEVMRLSDGVDDARERLMLLRELHMNQASNRLNQVMKVLTVWATIFLPLTFLAGIWGMNFRFMPELSKPWGYWAALGTMLLVAVGMIIYFKRKRWL